MAPATAAWTALAVAALAAIVTGWAVRARAQGRVERAEAARRDAEGALAEMRDELRAVQRIARVGNWEIDLDAETVEWSDFLYELFGIERDFELTFSSTHQLVHPDDRPRAIAVLADLRAGSGIFDFEHRIVRPDGRILVIRTRGEPHRDDAGRITGIRGTMQDVTEEKRVETELRRSEERFRAVAQATNDAIWDWNLVEDTVWWSQGFRALFGYEVNGVQPSAAGWSDLIHPEDQARVLRGIHAVIDDRDRTSWSDEYRFFRNDRTPILVADRGFVLRADDGTPLRMIGGMTDVTERRRAEAEVRRLAAELEERVRLRTAELEVANRELESFSYSVSHDLRAPLRAIGGFTRELVSQYAVALDETGRSYLDRVQRGVQSMSRLVDDLLDLARIARADLRRETVDLSALAADIAEELRRAEPQREVEFAIEPGLRATGDASLLRIALANLLTNAWKFTSQKPRAHVAFGALPARDGARRAFFVRDDGAGFDMSQGGKLFAPFQRLHSPAEFPGTGIGLATVERVVRRHGGRVWAESQPGTGATFYFEL
jgi:PAS domain S-box-containing protein